MFKTHSQGLHTLRSGVVVSFPYHQAWNQFGISFYVIPTPTHTHTYTHYSFSHSGGVLCGVGRDGHGKTLVVLWNTSQVIHSGEVSVLTKAHTEASIERMRIAAFDDSRLGHDYAL